MTKSISDGQKERRSDSKSESAKSENAKSALQKADGTLAFSLTAGAIGIGVALLDQAKAAAAVDAAESEPADLQTTDASDLAGQITTSTEFSTGGANMSFAVHDAPAMVAAVEPDQPMADPAGVDLMTLLQKIEDFLQHMDALATQDGQPAAAPALHSEGDIAETGSEQYASLDSATATDAIGSGTDVGGPISGGGHVVSPVGPPVIDPLDQFQDIVGKIDDLLDKGGPGSIPIVGSVVPGLLEPVDDVIDVVGDLVEGLLGGKEEPGLVSKVGETVEDTLDGVGDVVDGALGAVGDVVGDITETVGKVVEGLLGGGEDSGLLSPVGDLVDGALDTVGDVVGDITETVGDVVGGLTGTLDDLVGGITSTVTGTLDEVVGGVVTTVTGTLDGLVGGLLGGLLGGNDDTASLASPAAGTMDDTPDGAASTGIADVTTGILDGITSVTTGVLDGVGSLLGGLLGGGADPDPQEASADSVDGYAGLLKGLAPSADTISIAGLDDSLSSHGQEQPNIFEAAEGALQLSDGLISLLTPTIGFIGQSIIEGNDHHDFANSNGSLLHGLI